MNNVILANITDIELLKTLIQRVSTLSAVFQAVGGLILAYIIYAVIDLILTRKKNIELKRIRQLVEEINKKLTKKK